ncbi:Tetraspanin family-domain-containing protein [Paraphysoderma sedebokerense]|nr:Tetraspanin family-domain-containing protein [Paraphysoderma sedebokerense]
MKNHLRFFSRQSSIAATAWVLKNLVLLINVLALFAGVALFAIGIFTYTKESIVVLTSTTLPTACVVLGLFVLAVAFFGICGAANESPIFLKVYFSLISILIIAELIIGTIAFTHVGDLDYYLEKSWKTAYDPKQSQQTTIVTVQNYFKCCGFKSTTDMAIPENCSELKGFTKSCFEIIDTSFTNSLEGLGIGVITLGIIELLCLLFVGLLIYLTRLSAQARDDALLEEARKIADKEIEKERALKSMKSKKKDYNFARPFDIDNDGGD